MILYLIYVFTFFDNSVEMETGTFVTQRQLWYPTPPVHLINDSLYMYGGFFDPDPTILCFLWRIMCSDHRIILNGLQDDFVLDICIYFFRQFC